MIVEGKFKVEAPVQKVWDFLMDFNQFASCIPGLEDLSQVDDRTFDGVIGAKVGPMSGKFRFQASILEAAPPTDMKVRVEGQDDLTKSTVNAMVTLKLTPSGETGTQLSHHFNAEIKGRIAIVGDMILRGAAAVMLNEFAKRLRGRLEEGGAGSKGE
jgi:carbon monoxide dehydrogenase subunit G